MGKVIITDEVRNHMISVRNSLGVQDFRLAELIGRSRTWYYRVESGKTTTIDEQDYYNILDLLSEENYDNLRLYFENIDKEDIRIADLRKDIDYINNMSPSKKQLMVENATLKQEITELKFKLEKIRSFINEL